MLHSSSGKKYVIEKNKKEFVNDLKTIYHAPSKDTALEALDRVSEKMENDYPNAMKSWYKNWDVISPIFKFFSNVRKDIYTTNAIENLNSGYCRLNKQRNVFPSDTALLKALYFVIHGCADNVNGLETTVKFRHIVLSNGKSLLFIRYISLRRR